MYDKPDDTPLGEILVRQGSITEEELYRALAPQQITSNQLGQILMQLGALTEEQLESGLAYRRRICGNSTGGTRGGGIALRLVSSNQSSDTE